MKKVTYELKRCCGALFEDVKQGDLVVSTVVTAAQEVSKRLCYAGTPRDLARCPHCGDRVDFIAVIVEEQSESKTPAQYATQGLDKSDPDWAKKIQLNRMMTDFELKGLQELLEWQARQFGEFVDPSTVENFIDELLGPDGRWIFWREFSHKVLDLESYPCHGPCQDITEHYLHEDKAICSVCSTEQMRDADDDGIVAIINIWKKAEVHDTKDEVLGKVLVQQIDYMDVQGFRTILEVDGKKFEIGDVWSDRQEAINFAKDISAE